MKKFVVALALMAPAPAFAGAILAPVGAVIDLGGPGYDDIVNTYNQSGLSIGYTSGVTDFDSYIASNPTHSFLAVNEWFSNFPIISPTFVSVTYDLGAARTLDGLALWNEDGVGMGTLRLSYSLDGTSYNSLGMYAPINNPDGVDYPAQVFGFSDFSAQFVRVELGGCPAPDRWCALGEVAFRQVSSAPAVPEPTTWAMMLAGFGLMGAALRRKQKPRVRFAL